MTIARVEGYTHLTGADLQQPGESEVFYDLPDTETLAWTGADLIRQGDRVLDLGSGGGAATASFIRHGAARAHGFDISPESVAWATQTYARSEPRLSFSVLDFLGASADELLAQWPLDDPPTLVASNPPYVPCEITGDPQLRSSNGGPDGLAFLPAVLAHAGLFGADLGLVLGSYSNLPRAGALLADADLGITSVTLTPVHRGTYSQQSWDLILGMEREGRAAVWRPAANEADAGYLAVGIAATRDTPTLPADALHAIVARACTSTTSRLEALDAQPPSEVAIRVVDVSNA